MRQTIPDAAAAIAVAASFRWWAWPARS